MSQTSLYNRIGGAEMVQRITETLIANALLDDRLGPYFLGVDTQKVRSEQADLFANLLGASIRSTNPSKVAIPSALLDLGVEAAEFSAFLALLKNSLSETGVPKHLAEEFLWRVKCGQSEVFNHANKPSLKQKEQNMFTRAMSLFYGITCYVAGMASLLYLAGFIGDFLTPTRLDAPATGSMIKALGVNLILLGIFAIQHSVMARPSFKRVWTRWVPQTIERSTYILFSALALLPMFLFWQPMGIVIWQLDNMLLMSVIYAIYAAGWGIVVFSTFLLNHFDLFGLRQVWLNLRGKPYQHLAFSTPMLYRVVRHPLYFGWLIVMWATPKMTIAHLFFAMALTAYILIAIRLEERNLRDYHPEYAEYAKDVPMLIPGRTKKSQVSVEQKQTATA